MITERVSIQHELCHAFSDEVDIAWNVMLKRSHWEVEVFE